MVTSALPLSPPCSGCLLLSGDFLSGDFLVTFFPVRQHLPLGVSRSSSSLASGWEGNVQRQRHITLTWPPPSYQGLSKEKCPGIPLSGLCSFKKNAPDHDSSRGSWGHCTVPTWWLMCQKLPDKDKTPEERELC